MPREGERNGIGVITMATFHLSIMIYPARERVVALDEVTEPDLAILQIAGEPI